MTERPVKLPFAATHVIRASRGLSWGEKAVWLELWALDNGPEGAWISDQSLASRLGLEDRTVKNYRFGLRARRLAVTVPRPGARQVGWVMTLPAIAVPRATRAAGDIAVSCAQALDKYLEEVAVETAGDIQPQAPHLWTYFVRCGTDGPVKIGVASNVSRRVQELQIGSPEPLRLLAQTRSVTEVEAHRRWAILRLSGEWFESSPDLLAWIGSLQESTREGDRSPRARTTVAPPQGRPSTRRRDSQEDGRAAALGGKGGVPASASSSEAQLRPAVKQFGEGAHAPKAEDGGPESFGSILRRIARA